MRLRLIFVTLSILLNSLFIVDFLCYMFTSKGLGAFVFNDEGLQSLSGFITDHYDGMSASEFLLANGILLSFSVFLVIASVWIACYETGTMRIGGRR